MSEIAVKAKGVTETKQETKNIAVKILGVALVVAAAVLTGLAQIF